jgi:hypothetical protein
MEIWCKLKIFKKYIVLEIVHIGIRKELYFADFETLINTIYLVH